MSTNSTSKEDTVKLEELAQVSGVPIDFIKKELFLEDEVSMDNLRATMLKFIDATFQENDINTEELK